MVEPSAYIYLYILCSNYIRRVVPLNRYLFFPYFRPHRFSKTINLIQVMLQPRKSTSLKDYLLIAEDIKDYCRQCINQYGNLTLTYIQPKYVTKSSQYNLGLKTMAETRLSYRNFLWKQYSSSFPKLNLSTRKNNFVSLVLTSRDFIFESLLLSYFYFSKQISKVRYVHVKKFNVFH